MANSHIITIKPVFIRAEGFDPRQFNKVAIERLG
jgi:hypothetical protein